MTILGNNTFVSIANGTLSIVTPLENGIRLSPAANGSFLTILASFSPSYQNSTLGLIGNWNGNVEDDFTLPNGTVLPIDMTESEIFYKFGEECKIDFYIIIIVICRNILRLISVSKSSQPVLF